MHRKNMKVMTFCLDDNTQAARWIIISEKTTTKACQQCTEACKHFKKLVGWAF